jgi:hypothetical protein
MRQGLQDLQDLQDYLQRNPVNLENLVNPVLFWCFVPVLPLVIFVDDG